MQLITTAERRRRLGHRHFLAMTARTAEIASGALVGLHSSDPATVYLSCHSRVSGFASGDLERALYDDRSLLRMLGMRRTMFVVPEADTAMVDAACTQHLLAGERKRLVGYLEAQDVANPADEWLADVEARTLTALSDLGEATAVELKTKVPELGRKLTFGEGKKWAGEVGLSTRVLFLLATSNRIVRARPLGGWTSTQYRWTRTDTWQRNPPPEMDSTSAQGALVRRWLETYGPGTVNDIKWWTGWGVRVTRAALARCGAVEVNLDGEVGYLLPDDLDATPDRGPWAGLLPALDPTVMGWKDRAWYLGPHREALFDRNGNAGPTIWLNGRVVGGWGQAPNGEIRLTYLENVANSERQRVEAKATDLSDWLGELRFIPRFRTPVEKDLTNSP